MLLAAAGAAAAGTRLPAAAAPAADPGCPRLARAEVRLEDPILEPDPRARSSRSILEVDLMA